MIRLGFVGVAFLQSIRNILGHGAAQASILIPPHQSIVFARRADYALRVLVHFGIIVFFQGVFLLGVNVTTADFDGIQLVASNAAVEHLLTARLGIK